MGGVAPPAMAGGLVVDRMEVDDWPAVARIFKAGIDSGNATFEHLVPPRGVWLAQRLTDPRLVARDAETGVIGWAALSPASSREVYRGVAAVSIYVDPAARRRGVGRALLEELIRGSERVGIWTLEAGIFPENTPSVALHESAGFELVGIRRRHGQMRDGRWRDVALYTRRSSRVGGD